MRNERPVNFIPPQMPASLEMHLSPDIENWLARIMAREEPTEKTLKALLSAAQRQEEWARKTRAWLVETLEVLQRQ